MGLDRSHGLAVFSDGSAYHKDKSGGWAYVIVDINGDTESGAGHCTDTTVNRMELEAVIQALDYLGEEYGSSEILVFSDSEYVVLGCNDRNRKRNKNKRWWFRLDAAIEAHTHVEFQHVRGHGDSDYNNRADELAGEARRAGQSG